MKAAKGSIGRTVDQPPAHVRLFLFHGPDEGQSRMLGERLLKTLGASRFVIAAGAIKAETALLVDEAGAMSLFGGARAIWIEPAGDEITAAAEGLLAAPATESPVIAIGGSLKKTSALLKLAEAHPQALSHASYLPEGQTAARMVSEVGRTFGLRVSPEVAGRIADACGNDQAIVARELEKIALYLAAAPETPKEADHDAVDAIGAALPEGDFLRLADLALAGNMRELSHELALLSAAGTEAVPVIRSLQRRLMMIAPIRARVERGESSSAVMTSLGKSLFWKDETLVRSLIQTWDAAAIATMLERTSRIERQLMLAGTPAGEALGEELIGIARAARRR